MKDLVIVAHGKTLRKYFNGMSEEPPPPPSP